MEIAPELGIDTENNLDMCFGCGANNPIGLKLKFDWRDKVARAEFTPRPEHQGWNDVVHGGILCALLDEAMSYPPYFEGQHCVTARLEVRLKKPGRVGQPMLVSAWITKQSRRLLETAARVSLADGAVVAESTGAMYVVKDRHAGKNA